ncbi:MAG: ATP-binding cassette domain-containing protein [Pseudomonadota bacterium]
MAENSEAGVIELTQAGFSYGDTDVLTDASLTLAPGSFQCLTGPSGSGKTTFLRLCYLALFPTSGGLSLWGRDARVMDRDEIAQARRRIGIMHQNCAFLDHLSVAENVALPLTVTGRRAAEAAGDLEDLLNWVGLSHRADALPPELSGGERQRAALARAVISAPDIILADEPTGNLDAEMAERVLTLLIELNRLGKAVLVATHDMELIRQAKRQVPTRVLRLRGGTLHTAGADT